MRRADIRVERGVLVVGITPKSPVKNQAELGIDAVANTFEVVPHGGDS
jgi:hypothetical protein